MGYRDETETLRARVIELEEELDEANETIARLRGDGPVDEPRQRPRVHNALLGTHVRQVSERRLGHEVSAEGFEAIADALGDDISFIGKTLRAPGVQVRARGGQTKIEVDADARNNASALVAGAPLVGLLAAFMTFGLLHDISGVGEVALVGLVPLFVGLAFLALRPLHRRAADKVLREGRARLEQISDLAERYPAPPVRARVAVDEAEPAELEVEAQSAVEVATEAR